MLFRSPDFQFSGPEFLIAYLDRYPDWAVVVCLVGGGQEINRGEAGISAWLDAIRARFPAWRAYISSELTDSEYAAGGAIGRLAEPGNAELDNGLHLAVSMRSFRAKRTLRSSRQSSTVRRMRRVRCCANSSASIRLRSRATSREQNSGLVITPGDRSDSALWHRPRRSDSSPMRSTFGTK